MTQPFIYASPEQVTRDKAEYARRNIARGREVVALEYADGLIFVAENPSLSLHKISEIYDRIAFAGVGKYNEYESLRISGVQNAELTGYNYSRDDVNARGLANLYSHTLGRIFTESIKPFEAEIIVAQVAELGRPNEIYRITFDGILTDEHSYVAIGGRSDQLAQYLKDNWQEGMTASAGLALAVAALGSMDANRELNAANLEVAVLDRTLGRRKFRRLSDEQVSGLLQA